MKNLRLLLAVCFIGGLASVPLGAETESPIAGKRPPTHSDLWLMRRPGRPSMSPDGKWVVAPVDEPAYNPAAAHRDLWLFSADGTFPPRKITAGRNEQTGVEWSPTGLKIAFSSQRQDDEKPQIYVLDLHAGGEAERLTNVPGGARLPHWSPDGTKLLFTSDVAPENRDAPHAVRPAAVRAYERYPVRSDEHWLDDRRPRLFVQDAVAGAVATDLLVGTPFATSTVWRGEPDGKAEDLPATWTPDGSGVVFVGCVNATALAYSKPNTELFLISVRGGDATRLTQGISRYGRPCFTPDGHALVVRVTAETEPGYHLPQLVRYAWPWTTSDGTTLTENFDREPSDSVVSADGQHLYFTADEGGAKRLFSVPIGGGAPVKAMNATAENLELLCTGGGRNGPQPRLAAVVSAGATPPEVSVLEEKEGKFEPRRISDFNTGKITNLDLPAAESVTAKTMRGVELQSWLIRPAQFDPTKKYPVLLLVHDGPEEAASDEFGVDLNPHLLAGTKYVVLETNYRGSLGFGEAFTQSLAKDPVKGPAEDVIDALNAVVQDLAFIDGNHVAAIGVGYGGLVVNWLEATTTRFRCIVVQGGAVNPSTLWATTDRSFERETLFGGPSWEPQSLWHDQNPVGLAGNHAAGSGWLTPTLLAAGEKDFRAPLNTTLENWTYLQRLKVPSRLLVFPNEGHRFESGEDDRYFMQEVQSWLAQWFEAAPK